MLTIYVRSKNESGQWKATKVKEGRGIRTSTITGAFFVRPWVRGVQKRIPLHATVLAEARKEATELETLIPAQSRGLTVNEFSAMQNSNRIPLRSAVETYLERKKGKSLNTLKQYRNTLFEFLEGVGKVKFLDEITEDVLRTYKNFLVAKGFAGKTIDTRINIVNFLLKKNGILFRLPKDEMPIVEVEDAVPYSEEELKKLFEGKAIPWGKGKETPERVMSDEDVIIYKFFLGSGARDREVTFAAWADINFSTGKFTVRSKPADGFTVKNHESRSIPLPTSLLKELKARREKMPDSRWIFPTDNGGPGNHFLRKLKKIALRVGINCGQCKTTVTKGKYSDRKQVEVTCKTDPVCEHIYLHRLRKTCATRWLAAGIPVRNIQKYLGHKSLETTMHYLGVVDSEEVRDQVNEAFGD